MGRIRETSTANACTRNCLILLPGVLQMRAMKLFLVVALSLPFLGGCLQSTSLEVKTVTGSETIHVSLLVDFGNGSTTNAQAELNTPATVLDLLKAVQSDGGFEFEHSGAGETAFVNSINGVANEGNGGKNWTYRINGQLGDSGCGVANIDEGDEVQWTLGDYQPDEKD